jgi:hypothetical protein
VAVVSLAAVAGSEIEVDVEELRSTGRRALFVLAAGGDPHRGLDLRGPAVSELAAELDDPERRTTLADGLGSLRSDVAGLRHLSEALQALLDDPETAWRAYACSILAEQLAEE